MITYMPTIYPDELVYSWFCRYYVHSGCFSHKTALQELYCKKSDYLSKEFIGNLNNEAMEQIDEIYSLDKLVLDHTMYSQYARFIPLAEKKEALYRLGHDSCDVHYLFPVLPRNDGERYLRYCPLCVKRDRETYGEAYWHRKHQIRNMCICTQHKCRLMESSVPAKSEQSFTFCPAENYTYDREAVFENDLSVIQYMEYLVSVFDSVMDFENDIPISSILYDGMSRTKYLKTSGRSRYTKMLADDMNEFYRNMGICSVASVYQIQRVLLENLYDFSVVCQIAFYLGMRVEELTAPSLTKEQIEQEQLYLDYIRNGNVEGLKKFVSNAFSIQAGQLADNSLRQAKNILITVVTLVTRYAIEGGLDIESAYQLSDIYIQESEKLQNAEEIYQLQYNMMLDFTRRVAQTQIPHDITSDIYKSIQYIKQHTNKSQIEVLCAF